MGLDPPAGGLWALARVGSGPGWEEPCWAALHPAACTALRVSQRAPDPQVTECCRPMQSPRCFSRLLSLKWGSQTPRVRHYKLFLSTN